MVVDKQKFILLLLVLYILTLNIKLFIIGSIAFLAILLYYKKKEYIVLYLFVLYIFSIYLYKKNSMHEGFNTTSTLIGVPTSSTVPTATSSTVPTATSSTVPTTPNYQRKMNNLYSELDEQKEKENQAMINKALKMDINKNHVLTAKNYSELFFVLNSLLEDEYFTKNKESIEKVLVDYNVNDVFDLAEKVVNREENQLYNNFLERITCLDGPGNNINYLGCDNINYTKLFAFSELVYVYCLGIEKIIELINVHKIYKLCDLSDKRYILLDYDNQSSFGFEHLGLEYYLNEKYINDKYYRIIEMLELDLLLNNKNRAISLREKLYNYRDKNLRIVKDLNSIIILFEYYNIFDSLRINYDDDEYNWDVGIFRQIDLNRSYWNAISYFSDYKVKERIIKTINYLTKESENIFEHERVTNPVTETFQNIEHFESELTQKDSENKQTEFKLREYKTVNELNGIANKREDINVLDMLSLDYIFKNFNKKFTLIISELVELSGRRCNVDCNDYERPLLGKYIFYSKEILKILTKEERMFYVGLLLIFVAVLINFINMSK